jgi:hypothetical protein
MLNPRRHFHAAKTLLHLYPALLFNMCSYLYGDESFGCVEVFAVMRERCLQWAT